MLNWMKKKKNSSSSASSSAELKNECDVVPKTELSSSRQALNNISIGLSASEPSPSGVKKISNDGNTRECSNKFCCGENPSENDECSKSSFIDNIQFAADNSETECRRPEKPNNLIEFYDPYADYCKLECPDSPFNSIISDSGYQSVGYIRLKKKLLRFYSSDYDLFTTDNGASTDDKSQLNYELLFDIEKQLHDSKFNLINCRSYNDDLNKAQFILSCAPQWSLEDFNDDQKHTRMHEDTATIAEFYKLTVRGDILVHFHNIEIETGRVYEKGDANLASFLKWLFLKGCEMKHSHLVKNKKSSLIQIIKNFFLRKISKWNSQKFQRLLLYFF